MDKKRIMLYVDETLYDKIKELADEDSRSMNNFIVKLLEKELNSSDKQKGN